MKIKLGNVEFEVGAVSGQLRRALLSDPVILQGIWREVYRWDAEAQKGEILVPVARDGAVPLGNGVNFYVPRATPDGVVGKSDTASSRMASRFLEAVGAKKVSDVVTGITRLVTLPQKTIPLDAFSPLNAVASYTIRMHVEFAVVELRSASRNLTAYIYVPGQVAFFHALGTIKDDAGHQALLAANPALTHPQPAFIVPARSRPNLTIRMMALAKRIEEMQPALAAQKDETTPESEALRREFSRVITEWRAIAPKQAA